MHYSLKQKSNVKKIIRHGKCVYRPAEFWSKQVHKFLSHLYQKNFREVPKPLGFTRFNQEIVSYIEGDVREFPFDKKATSLTALVSAAKLLRNYHDAS